MEYNEILEYDGHRDRLRHRIEHEGVDALKNHELLEFLLCQVMPRQDMGGTARDLIKRFGDLRAMLHATDEQLIEAGLGEQSAEFLSLYFGCLRANAALIPKYAPEVKKIGDVYRRIMLLRPRITAPCCYQLCMDQYGRLMHEGKVCDGLDWAGSTALATALEFAIAADAATVILLIFGGSTPNAFRLYDFENARRYGSVLKSSNSALVDIMRANDHAVISMRAMEDMNPALVPPRLRLVCEEYMHSLPFSLQAE